MSLRRGFKAEANLLAREVRAELGLRPYDPIDLMKLVAHLDIPTIPLSELHHEARGAVTHFTRRNTSAFSAVTVFDETKRLIVYNDGHSDGRQSSDLAHELAHALLQHRPGPALDDHGCRYWNAAQEAEADWLGAALLVSEEAALLIARTGMEVKDATERYGVSRKMIQFRLNVTAACRRVRPAPTKTADKQRPYRGVKHSRDRSGRGTN